MGDLVDVILPVFIVVGFGYVATWQGLFSDQAIDHIVRFAQYFALPCLLFRAMATLDLTTAFEAGLLISFYSGAITSFLVGLYGARWLFARPWEDAVVIGFCCLFSNTVILGLPVTERAYGTEALAGNFAIIALHAPVCYLIGTVVMEFVRSTGHPPAEVARRAAREVFGNSILIGVALGLAFNLSGLTLPRPADDALSLVVQAALPTALFGLGGILFRYKPEGDYRTIAFICGVSLILHSLISWTLGRAYGVDRDAFRSLILTAAMAPGVNAFLFSNYYGVARRVVASSVLFGTALTVATGVFWLAVLE